MLLNLMVHRLSDGNEPLIGVQYHHTPLTATLPKDPVSMTIPCRALRMRVVPKNWTSVMSHPLIGTKRIAVHDVPPQSMVIQSKRRSLEEGPLMPSRDWIITTVSV
jgi:hypothetical protein